MATKDQELQAVINQLRKVSDDLRKVERDVRADDDTNLDYLEEKIKQTELLVEAKKEDLALEREAANLARDKAASMDAEIQRLTDLARHTENLSAKDQAALDRLNREYPAAKKEAQELAKSVSDLASEYGKTAKSSAELVSSLKKQNEASKKTQTAIGSLTTRITGFRGGLGSAITDIDKMKGSLIGMGESMKNAFGPAGVIDLFASFANVVLQAIIDLDEANWQMTTLAGSSERLSGTLASLRADTMDINASMQDLTQGLFSAWSGMSNFDKMSKDAQKSMVNQMAQLDKLGMAFEDQTRIQQFLNVSLGQTTTDAVKTTAELYNMSAASGKGVKELAADFQAAAPQLAVYGNKMTSEFRRMAAASKETGLEMGKLLGLAGMMDTFEGAAGIAGTLNAFLGGPYLNTVELVGMTEADRLIAIKRSMDAAGQSFSQMSRFKQKGVAKALNMDVAEASALFRANESAILQRSRAMEIAAKREEDYKKKIKETLPFMQALEVGFKDIAMSTMAAFLGLGENATPAEMVSVLSEKLKWLKGVIVKDIVPAVKSMFVGFAKFMEISHSATFFIGAIGNSFAVAARHIAWVGTQFAKMMGYVSKASFVWKFFGKVLGTIFGALFGVYHILKGIGNILTGNVLAGIMQIAGGGLEIGATAAAATGVGIPASLAMSVAGAGLAEGGSALADSKPAVNDFIYQGDGTSRGTIRPINTREQFAAFAPGGVVESAGMNGGNDFKEMLRLLKIIAGKDTTVKVGEDVLAKAVNKYNSGTWGVS